MLQRFTPSATHLRALGLLTLTVLLTACERAVLNPAGDVARQQRDIIYISTALMLLIIVPVMVLIVVFAWRYRKGKGATYDPHFDHSTTLELVIWSAPLAIIIILGALTWSSTHLLDPFRPINQVANSQEASTRRPDALRVQVVSLDWKWLFIYPEQGIATVNELVLPLNREVRFDLTSVNMMNTFYAPTMAGMIYTMPGMQSTLHAVMNRPGTYEGYSANYSGAGFSDMRFRLRAVNDAQFARWTTQVRGSGRSLDLPTYLQLLEPTEKVPPMLFGAVRPDLFQRTVERCLLPGSVCMTELMAHDMRTGGGHPSNVRPGAGMPPGRNSLPLLREEQPEGAIFKSPAERNPAPHISKPTEPEAAPGVTNPDSRENRNMSALTPPSSPLARAAAKA